MNTNIRTIASGNWVRLNEATYKDHTGTKRTWEYASRVNSNGVVTIIPITKLDKLVMIVCQYRPPVGKNVWEFPAGLIEAWESPGDAAIRELKEETGYDGVVESISPAVYTTPGLSSECGYLVTMTVDFDAQDEVETNFDPSEFIITKCVWQYTLMDFLLAREKQGDAIDAKLYLWALLNKA